MYIRIPLGTITRLEKGHCLFLQVKQPKYQYLTGAYIISPLEEASRDPVQNAGFSVHWHSSDQISMRMTSYSIRNSPEDAPVTSPPPPSAGSSTRLKPMLLRREPTNNTTLSRIMSKVSEDATGASDTCFAAFKVLPVEPARIRSGSSTRYAEPADDLAGATACNQVVDMMIGVIKRACEDAGNSPVVVNGDVVR